MNLPLPNATPGQLTRMFCLHSNLRISLELMVTSISLVPKVPSTINMTDYRPISCCNVMYKTVSKVLPTRLKTVVHLLVNSCQAAFVSGRSILDEILVMQELVRDDNRISSPPRSAMNIDIMKTVDTRYCPTCNNRHQRPDFSLINEICRQVDSHQTWKVLIRKSSTERAIWGAKHLHL